MVHVGSLPFEPFASIEEYSVELPLVWDGKQLCLSSDVSWAEGADSRELPPKIAFWVGSELEPIGVRPGGPSITVPREASSVWTGATCIGRLRLSLRGRFICMAAIVLGAS